MIVNSSELVDCIAEHAGLSRSEAERALKGILYAIAAAIKAGDVVGIEGFGTFRPRARSVETVGASTSRRGGRTRGVSFSTAKSLESQLRADNLTRAVAATKRAAAPGLAATAGKDQAPRLGKNKTTQRGKSKAARLRRAARATKGKRPGWTWEQIAAEVDKPTTSVWTVGGGGPKPRRGPYR